MAKVILLRDKAKKKMGNICKSSPKRTIQQSSSTTSASSNSGGAKSGCKAPVNLSELVRDVASSAATSQPSKTKKPPTQKSPSKDKPPASKDTSIGVPDVDTLIGGHDWCSKFQKYLRGLKPPLTEEEDMLGFLVMTEIILFRNAQQPKGAKNTGASELFGNLLKRHFSEDSEHMVPLTNQKLFDIFAAKAEKKPGGGDALVVDNETVQHLELAKKDVSASLDSTYIKFLQQTPVSNSLQACLLSIL